MKSRTSPGIWAARVALLAALLLAWQFLPQITALRDVSVIFDPFFVSAPSRIYERLVDMFTGGGGQPSVWPYFWQTIKGTLLGVLIGTVAGCLAGLLLSNSQGVQQTVRPFLNILNATPRIALIPVIVIIAGPTLTATVMTAVLVVFFLVFYNAFAGGTSVPIQTLQNARLLGASSGEVMRQIRFPYVMVWTFTSLPNAVSFGLISVVTAELLTGKVGMGQLLLNSISFSDSTGTFAIVTILAIAGVIMVSIAELAERRVLHWWKQS